MKFRRTKKKAKDICTSDVSSTMNQICVTTNHAWFIVFVLLHKSPPKSLEFSTKLLGRFREIVGVFWLDFEDPPPIPRRTCNPPPFLLSSYAGTQHFDFWQLGASISGAFGQP